MASGEATRSDDSEWRVERRVASGEWRVAAVRGGEPGGVRVRVAAATPSLSQLSDSEPESAPGRLGVTRGEGGRGEGFTPSPPQSDSERRGEESDSEW